MKTRQQKQREALARRESDYAKYIGKAHAANHEEDRERFEQQASRAQSDIRNLKLRLGVTS